MCLINILLVLCLFLLLNCSMVIDIMDMEFVNDDFVIMAYYVVNDWFLLGDLFFDKFIYIIYFFSNIVDGEMAFMSLGYDLFICVFVV